MNNLPTILLNILLSGLLFLFATHTIAHGWKTPEEAVNAYIKGVKTGSGKHIEMAFTASANIQYYNEKGGYQTFTRDAFKDVVDTGKHWDVTIDITHLKKIGNIANATVEFTWGASKEKGYVDYLNLIYDDKKSWHITDKVAQYVTR